MTQAEELSLTIKREARRLGFDLCRIVPVQQAPHADFFELWLERGSAGDMRYLERAPEKRRSPALLAEGEAFQSLLVLAVDYHQLRLPEELTGDPSRGIIASYAWGDDYHELIRPLLYQLDAFIRELSGRTTLGKCLVDTGPILERDWAQLSGVGFVGKNTCVISPKLGSWLFLATMLVPELLSYDAAPLGPAAHPDSHEVARGLPGNTHFGTWHIPLVDEQGLDSGDSHPGTCGRCTRCLTACPTDAFVGPYHLDPRRCISYWTIETQAAIPVELRPRFGNRIYGCDACQECCPWSRGLPDRQPRVAGLVAQHARLAPPLLEGFRPGHPYWLDDQAFALHFTRSPIKRARRSGMLRNVCVALGNWAAEETVDPLGLALNDREPIPRAHAAWALGQVVRARSSQRALEALRARLAHEDDAAVLSELATALS